MTHDYLIIGAGPAGLQLAALLVRDGHDYAVLERGTAPGTFFTRYPRHRRLNANLPSRRTDRAGAGGASRCRRGVRGRCARRGDGESGPRLRRTRDRLSPDCEALRVTAAGNSATRAFPGPSPS